MAGKGMSKEEKDIRRALDRAQDALNATLQTLSDPLGVFISLNAGRWIKIGNTYKTSEGDTWTVMELPYVTGTVPDDDGNETESYYVAIRPDEQGYYWRAARKPPFVETILLGFAMDPIPLEEQLEHALCHKVELTLNNGTKVRGDAMFLLPVDSDLEDGFTLLLNDPAGKNLAFTDDEIAAVKVLGYVDKEYYTSAFRDKKCWNKDGTAPTLSEAVEKYGQQFLFNLLDNLRFIADTAGESVTSTALTALLGDGEEK